jgi:hypothetical protein
VTWLTRLREADRRAVRNIAAEETRDTGEGWWIAAVASGAFAFGTVVFLVTGGWWLAVPAAVGAVFLGAEAVRKRRRALGRR